MAQVCWGSSKICLVGVNFYFYSALQFAVRCFLSKRKSSFVNQNFLLVAEDLKHMLYLVTLLCLLLPMSTVLVSPISMFYPEYFQCFILCIFDAGVTGIRPRYLWSHFFNLFLLPGSCCFKLNVLMWMCWDLKDKTRDKKAMEKLACPLLTSQPAPLTSYSLLPLVLRVKTATGATTHPNSKAILGNTSKQLMDGKACVSSLDTSARPPLTSYSLLPLGYCNQCKSASYSESDNSAVCFTSSSFGKL